MQMTYKERQEAVCKFAEEMQIAFEPLISAINGLFERAQEIFGPYLEALEYAPEESYLFRIKPNFYHCRNYHQPVMSRRQFMQGKGHRG